MVGTTGFEPATSRTPSVNWSGATECDRLLSLSVFFAFRRLTGVPGYPRDGMVSYLTTCVPNSAREITPARTIPELD
jgi:hypothetical protein